MSDKPTGEAAGGITVGDIYFVLFRHKWMILFFSALGLIAAAAILVVKPAPYQSTAQVEIKYAQLRPGAPATSEPVLIKSDTRPDAMFNDEITSLKSRDSLLTVVTNVGPERILAKLGGGTNFEQALDAVRYNLIVEPPSHQNILTIGYQHPDRDLPQAVLIQVIGAFVKMHQPAAVSPEALAESTNRLNSLIASVDAQLNKEKSAAGVTSLEEDKKLTSALYEDAKIKLRDAEGNLAQHCVMLEKLAPAPASKPAETNAVAAAPTRAEIEEYARARSRYQLLEKTFESVEIQYNTNTTYYLEALQRLKAAQSAKEKLEDQYPSLTALAVQSTALTSQPGATALDPTLESATVESLKSLTNFWNASVNSLHDDYMKIEEHEPTIRDLEASKARLKATLNSTLSRAEQSDLSNLLANGGGQGGIKVVQSPSPAVKKWSKSFQNKVAMVAGGGIGFGLVLAFLIELVLDRSVKRAVEIETKLRLPLFISIPNVNRNGHRRRHQGGGKEPLLLPGTTGDGEAVALVEPGRSGKAEVEPWDKRHALHRYYSGLRDRLIVYFEVRNLVHKPKLVAVTSCHKGAGVSTIAAGLAASLSQTGDGNVLLVDMNEEQGGAQQFHKGSPGCGLDVALESDTMKTALVEGNLYVANDRQQPGGKIQRVPHGRLANLMPKLKASDYDYIIFDMPAVTQTSTTARLSGLMDMVLLVIESEKTNQDVVKRAVALLGESKATVSTVLNKTRSYVPAQLHQEGLSDS